MTKLSNGIDYTNHKFNYLFAEYLILNNFLVSKSRNGKLMFYKENSFKIIVEEGTLHVFRFNIEKENDNWEFGQAYTGLEFIDFFGFVFLMHIMRILSISYHIEAGMLDVFITSCLQTINNTVKQKN